MHSNTNDTWFDSNWISTKVGSNNYAIIVNKGTLEAQDIIGVPKSSFGTWIENHQNLFVDNFRFGGEKSWNNSTVHNISDNGKLIIENSWLNAERAIDDSIIYVENFPSVIALRSNIGVQSNFSPMLKITEGISKGNQKIFVETNNIPPTTFNKAL